MEIKKENLISKFFHLPKTIIVLSLIHLIFSLVYCRNIFFEKNCFYEIIYAIVGFLIIFFLNFILSKLKNSKLKYKKVFVVCFSIFSVLAMLVFEFVYSVIVFFVFNLKDIIPRKPFYSMYISKMSDDYYRIKHFPKKLPRHSSKYYFELEQDFFGYNTNYLKFKTDEEYINKTIEENKDDIYKTIKLEDIYLQYKFIDSHFNIKDKENYTVYILENHNDDSRYTSGFLTSKNGDIIFFYSNFDLRKKY